VIKDFVEAHPEDSSVACFGFELIRYGSFYFYYEGNDLVHSSMRSIIRHEMDAVVQEYAIHFMWGAMNNEDMGLVDKVQETEALHASLQAMPNHPNNLNVQVVAIHWISHCNRVDNVHETDALHACLQAMCNHPDNSNVQVEACRALS
jgi:hypothetical protein